MRRPTRACRTPEPAAWLGTTLWFGCRRGATGTVARVLARAILDYSTPHKAAGHWLFSDVPSLPALGALERAHCHSRESGNP